MEKRITFALFFGNRGFFPGELIASAREELAAAVEKAGYGYIMAPAEMTRYGAVETPAEGKKYAAFLKEHQDEYQGIIVCLPNFGDENGALEALRDCRVPILVDAYRDQPGKMDFAHRRDSMCGKIALCNVLRQHKINYTLLKPFCCNPTDEIFASRLEHFAAICRVVNGMRHFNIGVIGARTSAFKTVRFDEIAMQNVGINIETIDMSQVFSRMRSVDPARIATKKAEYLKITDFSAFPESKLDTIAKLGVVIDDFITELDLQGVAIRCWDELEKEFGVAPCLALCELNERGIAASCETDVNNTVMTRAISLAAAHPTMLLDVNNNYGTDPDKCILFHCGPVPISLLKGKGITVEHLMFRKSYGPGTGVGVNRGRIINCAATVGSLRSENGKLYAFVTEGKLTPDEIEDAFFGTGIVFEKQDIESFLQYMGYNGYRHHVCVTKGRVSEAVAEALGKYLGYEIEKI